MNTDDIRVALAELDAPVVPAPDPYGRLLRRARRSRGTRWGAAVAAFAALVVAAALSPGLATGTGGPAPDATRDPDMRGGEVITPWLQRLLDTPTAGSLAGDTGFRDTLTTGLRPPDFGLSGALNRVTVLYAGDVGNYRAVLLAFHSRTHMWEDWLVGAVGTAAERFVQWARTLRTTPTPAGRPIYVVPQDPNPYSSTSVSVPGTGSMAVVVTPAGCRVATKPDLLATEWTDLPTGHVAALSDPYVLGMYARVTCAGVVRFAGLLSQNGSVQLHADDAVSDQQVADALVGARGTPADPGRVRFAIAQLVGVEGNTGGCRVLYHGAVPGSTQPPVLVVACATASGYTRFLLLGDDAPAVATVSGDVPALIGQTRIPFGAPLGVLALRLPVRNPTGGPPAVQESDRVLVVGPPDATVLKVPRPGGQPETVPLSGGVGSFVRPVADDPVNVQVLDANGAVVGTGTAPIPQPTWVQLEADLVAPDWN